jgi:hypothetical protein
LAIICALAVITIAFEDLFGCSALGILSRRATSCDDGCRMNFIFLDRGCLALQLRFLRASESMGNHDSEIVDAGSVD